MISAFKTQPMTEIFRLESKCLFIIRAAATCDTEIFFSRVDYKNISKLNPTHIQSTEWKDSFSNEIFQFLFLRNIKSYKKKK